LKTGSIPGKADLVAQKEFLENTMEPIISEAKEGKCLLFYVDAAHFVMLGFLGYLWSKVRVFVPTPSGRQRYNVLGAFNAMTDAMTTVTNTSYINSASVIELLSKLRHLHPGQSIKIVLDNASYQRNYLVRWHAAILDIELVFLPSYSPNLNLIERYWKFVKKKCLYNQFYGDFESFCAAIDDCVNNGNKKYADELKSLMTLNFQTFENVQFLAV
jgi:transposase